MRQKIERDRMRKNCSRFALRSARVAHRATATRFSIFGNLLGQFADCARAAARHGLIARSEDAAHAKRAMQRIKRHQRNRCGTIWIGNQTAMSSYIFRIDFGNDQRNVPSIRKTEELSIAIASA